MVTTGLVHVPCQRQISSEYSSALGPSSLDLFSLHYKREGEGLWNLLNLHFPLRVPHLHLFEDPGKFQELIYGLAHPDILPSYGQAGR